MINCFELFFAKPEWGASCVCEGGSGSDNFDAEGAVGSFSTGGNNDSLASVCLRANEKAVRAPSLQKGADDFVAFAFERANQFALSTGISG